MERVTISTTLLLEAGFTGLAGTSLYNIPIQKKQVSYNPIHEF